MDDLSSRTGLPDALRVLLETLPRSGWETHPNFDGLTRFWLERHLMFREVLGRLRADAEARLDGSVDPLRHARETRRLAGFLLNELHMHHQIEDHHYFPKLQGLDERLSRGFEILDADHQALDGHIQALADVTNGYLSRFDGAEAGDRIGRLRETLAGFETFLDRHLTDEEDLIVPVILTHAPSIG
jgi:iron-sulfur cluster repair protein YtfE (RIC family)